MPLNEIRNTPPRPSDKRAGGGALQTTSMQEMLTIVTLQDSVRAKPARVKASNRDGRLLLFTVIVHTGNTSENLTFVQVELEAPDYRSDCVTPNKNKIPCDK